MKLKPFALGIALGLIWGGVLSVTTWLSLYTGYGKLFLEAIPQSLYPGYTISALGGIMGFIYGFLDGLICGVFIGWIYNRIMK